MKLIATRRGRADKYDDLRCVRRDGSVAVLALDERWRQVPRHGTLELELPDA